MPNNARIAKIALKMAFLGLSSLHESVMGFYESTSDALNALERGNNAALQNALNEMDKHSGISAKMLSISNALEVAKKSGISKQLASYLKQAFGALLPDMRRTYDFYGRPCLPYKAEFEKLARKVGTQVGAL